MESALSTRCALSAAVLLLLLVLSGPLFSPARVRSEEAEPAASEAVERELTYDGSDDGLFGPGDGEPAVNFRLRSSPDDADVGLLSVHLNDRYLYTIGLPRADAVAPIEGIDEGFVLRITQKQAETVLGRELDDPDLPPVTVSCVLYNRLTMGLVDVITWDGYLQGCWLEFPSLAPASEEGDEPTRVLKPSIDISGTLGQAMPIDLRLGKDTIYYMLFASEDREAVLLHPENPEIYSRARVVAGGTFSWKPEANRKRLKYTPSSDRTYLVLWALHRAAEETEESAGTEESSVSGWTRSAVYELTNGPSEE